MPDATICGERTKPIPAAAKRAMDRGIPQRKAIAMAGNPVSTPVKVG